jgi:hypothetical protein
MISWIDLNYVHAFKYIWYDKMDDDAFHVLIEYAYICKQWMVNWWSHVTLHAMLVMFYMYYLHVDDDTSFMHMSCQWMVKMDGEEDSCILYWWRMVPHIDVSRTHEGDIRCIRKVNLICVDVIMTWYLNNGVLINCALSCWLLHMR